MLMIVILHSDVKITKINNKLSTDLDELVKWLNQNHLTVNTKKLNACIFDLTKKNVLLTPQ